MDALTKLKSFWGYISPQKAHQPPKPATLKNEPVVINFLEGLRKQDSGMPMRGGKAQKVITGRVVKNTTSHKSITSAGTKNIVKEKNNNSTVIVNDSETTTNDTVNPMEYDFNAIEEDPEETETIILVQQDVNDDEPTFVDDDDEYKENRKFVEKNNEDEEESVGPEDEDLEITLINDDADSEESEQSEESEVSGEDKVMHYLSNQYVAPGGSPHGKSKSSRQSEHDFHPDEAALWARLEARGNEPLLPLHWSQDFRTFTADFFSSDLEETFINSASGKDFQAIKALISLIALGPLVRERKQAGLPREELIAKEFRSYMRWAERDGGYVQKRFIPIHAIVEARPKMSIKSISSTLEDQLSYLAQRHRRLLLVPSRNGSSSSTPTYRHTPPLLYGILIVRSKFIVCTMDSASVPEEGGSADVRTLAAFDFQEKEMDIWNAFAMAIVAVTVRNHMMQLKELGELGATDEEEEDPDL